MRQLFLLLWLLVTCHGCSGQLIDSLHGCLKNKPKFNLKFDSRNSFITESPVVVTGVKAIWEFGPRLRVGVGYNFLGSLFKRNLISRVMPSASGDPHQNDTSYLRLRYLTPYIEYIFFKNKKWEHSIPVHIGFGTAFWKDTLNGEVVKLNQSPVIFYEPSMTTEFRFVPWVGVGAGAGYRLSFINNRSLGARLTSPLYVVRLKLYLGPLVRLCRGKEDV